MAAAAAAAAKMVVTQILPVLYDGYQKRARIIETAKRCEVSIHKAEELLKSPAISNRDEKGVEEAVTRLTTCVNVMHGYLKNMAESIPENGVDETQKEVNEKTASKGSALTGIIGGAKKAVDSAIKLGRGTIDALMGEHEKKLDELNQQLLLASVDLGLVISRLPTSTKSSVCFVQ